MGTPLKNQNFENRASICFKLAQIRPRAKISWAWDFWWLRKTRTNRQTNPQDSCFISIDIVSMNPLAAWVSWGDSSADCICTGCYLRSVSDFHCAHQTHDLCGAHKHSFTYCLRVGHTQRVGEGEIKMLHKKDTNEVRLLSIVFVVVQLELEIDLN